MELIVSTEIKNAMLQSRIPELLGGAEHIFYRSTIRDTELSYVNYIVNLEDVPGKPENFRHGEVIFDIWNYATTSTLPQYVQRELVRLFDRSHLVAEGIEATRMWFRGGIEASVENNRSNRRSEDEFIYKREVSFEIQGYDLLAQQSKGYDIPQQDAWGKAINPTIRSQQIVDAYPQPDGVLNTFQLPETASQVYYYLLDGLKGFDIAWEPGEDLVTLAVVPAAGTRLKIAYVPE